MQNLDDKDRQILATLQSDASVPAETVGEQVGLSTTSVQRRVKRMLSDRVNVRQSCEIAVDHSAADLGKKMGAAWCPAHLLPLAHPLAQNLFDSRFSHCRRNGLRPAR